jgi:hypothetical protein
MPTELPFGAALGSQDANGQISSHGHGHGRPPLRRPELGNRSAGWTPHSRRPHVPSGGAETHRSSAPPPNMQKPAVDRLLDILTISHFVRVPLAGFGRFFGWFETLTTLRGYHRRQRPTPEPVGDFPLTVSFSLKYRAPSPLPRNLPRLVRGAIGVAS